MLDISQHSVTTQIKIKLHCWTMCTQNKEDPVLAFCYLTNQYLAVTQIPKTFDLNTIAKGIQFICLFYLLRSSKNLFAVATAP